MAKQMQAKLLEKIQLTKDIYHFKVQAKEMVEKCKPGNFIEIRVSDQTEPFLRRSISIYNLDKENGILEFIFQVKGNGTKILARKEVGQEIDIIGPLGFGTFKYDGNKDIAIIGGGIGIFPLYELAKQAKESGIKVNTYLGFRNRENVILESEFKNISDNLTIASGPIQMLRAVKQLAEENNIPCQVSLEEKMGCGLGACLGCAVKTAKSPKEAPEYFHVCKGGPVFNSKDVEF